MVRSYDFHDEACYVVRRADGTPLAVPVWMTRPEAAYAKIVSVARLPVRVLLELRRVTAICLSSGAHNVHEEDHDAAVPSKMPTGTLPFQEPPAALAVRLPLDVQQQLRQVLVQWMRALATMIREEDHDEQDHR